VRLRMVPPTRAARDGPGAPHWGRQSAGHRSTPPRKGPVSSRAQIVASLLCIMGGARYRLPFRAAPPAVAGGAACGGIPPAPPLFTHRSLWPNGRRAGPIWRAAGAFLQMYPYFCTPPRELPVGPTWNRDFGRSGKRPETRTVFSRFSDIPKSRCR